MIRVHVEAVKNINSAVERKNKGWKKRALRKALFPVLGKRIMKEKSTDLKYMAVILAAVLLICGMSKNSPVSNGVPLTDSSVFQYIGYRMWRYGELPYIDFFDHKGPIIYFINMLGTFLSLRYGIFVVELVFMFITLFFTWKTLSLFSNKLCALIGDIGCFLFLYDFFECGNLVEEYSMAFMAISIYLFSDYYKNKKTTGFRIAVTGVCFACVLLLRPNMIGIWIVFCCAIALKELCRREYAFVLQMIGCFFLGAVIIIVPVICYLLWNHALSAFLDCYLTFNFAYSGSEKGSVLYSFYSYCRTEFFAVTCILWFLSIWTGRNVKWLREYFFVCASALVVSMLLCCMTGNPVPHYLMTVFPVAAVGYAYGISRFCSRMETRARRFKAGFAGIILCVLIFQLLGIKNAYIRYQGDGDSAVAEIAQVIRENSDTKDEMTVFGNACKYYLASDRRAFSRYIYQYPIGEVRPSIMEEYFGEMNQNPPAIVVIDHTFDMGEEDSRVMMDILLDSYELLYDDEYAAVWTRYRE